MILFDDVAAGDVGLGSILGSELFDVHATLATLDLLLQNVNPEVIPLPEFPMSLIEENLDEPRTRGVASDAIAAWDATGQVPRGMQKLFQGCGKGCVGPGTGCG